MKKEAWENDYENYKSKYDPKDIEKSEERVKRMLSAKLGKIRSDKAKSTNSKEYRRLSLEEKEFSKVQEETLGKSKQVFKNLARVEKVKESRDKKQNKLNELVKQRNDREKQLEERKNLKEKIQKLEIELSDLNETRKHCLYAIKNPNAPAENKENAKIKLAEIEQKIADNNANYSKLALQLNDKESEELVKAVSEKDMKELEDGIKRDNKICELLMQGYAMKDVITQLKKEKIVDKNEVSDKEDKKDKEDREAKENEVLDEKEKVVEEKQNSNVDKNEVLDAEYKEVDENTNLPEKVYIWQKMINAIKKFMRTIVEKINNIRTNETLRHPIKSAKNKIKNKIKEMVSDDKNIENESLGKKENSFMKSIDARDAIKKARKEKEEQEKTDRNKELNEEIDNKQREDSKER